MTTTLDHLDDAEIPTVEPTLVHIGLDHLHPADDNPRTDLGDLEELADTIQQHGIIEPLVVIERHVGGGYTIVAGHRRAAAARLAGIGVVPCIVRTFDSTESRIEAMAVENLQRSGLTPLDESRAFQMLTELGQSQRDIAARVGCSQSHVSRRLSLARLPDKAREMLTVGRITVRQAERLAELPDDEIDEVVAAVATRTSAGMSGEPIVATDWTVVAAVRRVSKRKHAEALRTGDASGLTQLRQRPYEAAGEFEPCGKRDATHWFVEHGTSTVIWARKRDAKAPTPFEPRVLPGGGDLAARLAAHSAKEARVRGALETIGGRLVGGDEMLAEHLHEWAIASICDDLAEGVSPFHDWATLDTSLRADLSDDRQALADLSLLVGECFAGLSWLDIPDAYELLVTFGGYVPADDEHVPEIEGVMPVASPEHDELQDLWEASYPFKVGTSPWPVGSASRVRAIEVVQYVVGDGDDDANWLRHVIAFERHGAKRSEVLDAARARLAELLADEDGAA